MTKTEFHLREALEQISQAAFHVVQLGETYSKSKEKFAFKGDLLKIGGDIIHVLNNIQRSSDSHHGIQVDPLERLLVTTAQTRIVIKQAQDLLGKMDPDRPKRKPDLSIVKKEDLTDET